MGNMYFCLKRNKKKRKKSPLKHQNQAQCWVRGSKDTFTAPLVQSQINWLTDLCIGLNVAAYNKNYLYFALLTSKGMITKEENPEKSILVMPKFTTTIAIF